MPNRDELEQTLQSMRATVTAIEAMLPGLKDGIRKMEQYLREVDSQNVVETGRKGEFLFCADEKIGTPFDWKRLSSLSYNLNQDGIESYYTTRESDIRTSIQNIENYISSGKIDTPKNGDSLHFLKEYFVGKSGYRVNLNTSHNNKFF